MGKWYTLYSNILYMHFSEGYYNLPDSAKNAASPHTFGMRLIRVSGHTLLRLLGNLFQSVEKPELLRGKTWLYVVSQNNVDSLQFLQQQLPDSLFVAGQGKDIGRYNKEVARLSLRRKILYYYKFFPLLWSFYKHKKRSTVRFFDLLYDAIGFYETYYRKLKQYKPAAVIFANDHNADARAMLLAAKVLGIKTIYIQHASVSTLFPPLAFDLSLLEGQDALDKYKQCGPVQGEVKLVGMPKADSYVPFRNFSNEIKTVGIGCNLMDELGEVEKVLRDLANSFPELRFILRPHPRDSRNLAALTKISNNISVSNGKTEAVFDYLKNLDVLVSGNSGIHLEAVLLNVWSIFYEFNPLQPLHDYYGFINKGLVDTAASPGQLRELLSSNRYTRPQVYTRAQYFNATVATPDDGKSSEISLVLLQSFLRNR